MTATTMRAMRVHQFGPPEVIVAETVPVPRPSEGEVLVQVHAAGVGPWDAWVRAGRSVVPQPLPLTPGSDVAGTVVALGPDINEVKAGDAIYGVTNKRFTDGYAEFAICQAKMIALKPMTLSDVEAASVPVIAVTAWQCLFDHAAVRAGQSVLIQGGAGNVGRYAVQLASRAGLRVVASALNEEVEALRRLGADATIGRDLTTDERFDAIVDLVGGSSQAELFGLLKEGGILVSTVSEPDHEAAANAQVRALFMLVDVTSDVLAELAERFESGKLESWVGTVLPLEDAERAHRMLEREIAAAPGKIVLSVA